jgi:serine protease Do
MNKELATGLNIDHTTGILVFDIENNSPADKAGLVVGDLVFKINEVEINNVDDAKKELKELRVGDIVILEVEREGRLISLKMVLEEVQ